MSLMLFLNVLPKSVMILPGRDGIPEDCCIISVAAKYRNEVILRWIKFLDSKETTIVALDKYRNIQVGNVYAGS